MQKRQKPPILIGEHLITIFDNGIKNLEEIQLNLVEYENLNGLNAAYLFAYSVFEGTLYNIYSKVLKAFPDKAKLEYNRIDKNTLFKTSRTSVVIDKLCTRFSQNFGHDRFCHYISDFNDIVDIDIDSINFPENELDDFKTKRNELAHRGCGNLTINGKSPISKCLTNSQNLIISRNLAERHIEATIETLNYIREKFIPKYSKYTDIELIKKSCFYVFNMFEHEFHESFVFENGKVGIKLEPIENVYSRLSSSEKHCFLLFIANYNAGISNKFKISDLMPRVSLGDDTLDRIAFISDLFEEYPHLINR